MMAERVRVEATKLLEVHIGEKCVDYEERCYACEKWKHLEELLKSPY
jgi:hypothetical protein